MPSPATEIVTFPSNDAAKSDPDLFTKVRFTQLLAEKSVDAGLLGQAWGTRLEDPGIFNGFLNWPTIEHHKKIAPTLETDPDIQKAFQTIVGGVAKIVHVMFNPYDNYTKAVASPITEIIYTRLNDGANVNEFKAAIEYALDTSGASEGCFRGAWGFTVEDEKVAVLVIGWESREAHSKYEGSKELEETKAKFKKVGVIESLFHVKFKETPTPK